MHRKRLKDTLYDVIFEADTRAGKIFDVLLLAVIVVSVLLVMLESIPSVSREHYDLLVQAEWVITFVFTLEYIVRIIIVKRPWKYIFSFYGIIDFLAIIPTYLAFFIVSYQSLVIIRIFRLLRVFRILKLSRYTSAGRTLIQALWNSREKISVFIFFVVILVIIMGTFMYLIEGEERGFTSIPLSIYWAVVTLTTVGYGDLSPVTPTGQFLASLIMIMGYAIIAVPTGIVTAEMIKPSQKNNTQVCPGCLADNHDDDAVWCKKCGAKLNPSDG